MLMLSAKQFEQHKCVNSVNHVNSENHINSVNSVYSENSVNSVISVNSVNSVSSYSAVLPPYPMVFFSGLDIIFWILTRYPFFPPQGVAASNLPTTVFAVIDMYGKCAQVVNSSILQDFLRISIECIVLMMSLTGVFDG